MIFRVFYHTSLTSLRKYDIVYNNNANSTKINTLLINQTLILLTITLRNNIVKIHYKKYPFKAIC